MNNSNENIDKDLKEDLKDDYREKSEDQQSNEIGSNDILETQEDPKINTDETDIEEPGTEIMNSMNETTDEILETQDIEKELM